MKYSTYNIFSKIRDSENYYIINILTGSADIISAEDAVKISSIRDGNPISDSKFTRELAAKGYIIEAAEEERLYKSKYLDFIDSRDEDEIQIFFVTNYSCNFACTYCYQDEYSNPGKELSREIVDSFFSYVQNEFAGRQKYITIFGGEPLLPGNKQKEIIAYIVEKSLESNLELCFVTNGYALKEYSSILSRGKIREIQVTLDGTEKVHDKRRFLKGGNGTFNKIVEGIDSCLNNNIAVNLRMVIDKENIDNLPDLANFAIEKGWTENVLFKTQVGRNYELHHCQSAHDKLFDRISIYENIYELTKKNPGILEFYKPAYSVSKFLFENGELPDPLFDACPACKTEWAMDYTGNIYSCTATVGKENESLGTFHPIVARKEDIIEEWQNRDIISIDDCKNCPVQLACGGGCGSVAKNRTGSVCSTDCRPVKELLELGFSTYFRNTEV